jgi:hypothetical protein
MQLPISSSFISCADILKSEWSRMHLDLFADKPFPFWSHRPFNGLGQEHMIKND